MIGREGVISLYELFRYAGCPVSWKEVVEILARWEKSKLTEWGENWDGGWLIRIKRYDFKTNSYIGTRLIHAQAWRDWSDIWTDEMGCTIEHLRGDDWPEGYEWQNLNLKIEN